MKSFKLRITICTNTELLEQAYLDDDCWLENGGNEWSDECRAISDAGCEAAMQIKIADENIEVEIETEGNFSKWRGGNLSGTYNVELFRPNELADHDSDDCEEIDIAEWVRWENQTIREAYEDLIYRAMHAEAKKQTDVQREYLSETN